MIDPVNLRLIKQTVQPGTQLKRRRQISTKRLFDNNPQAVCFVMSRFEAARAQVLDRWKKQRGGNRQVNDSAGRHIRPENFSFGFFDASMQFDIAVRGVQIETVIEQSFRKLLPFVVGNFSQSTMLRNSGLHFRSKLIVGLLAASDSEDR